MKERGQKVMLSSPTLIPQLGELYNIPPNFLFTSIRVFFILADLRVPCSNSLLFWNNPIFAAKERRGCLLNH